MVSISIHTHNYYKPASATAQDDVMTLGNLHVMHVHTRARAQ